MKYYREVNAVDARGEPKISLIEYYVVSKTSKGAWIAPSWDQEGRWKRFVLDGDGKRWAYPSKQLARKSFIRRKRREIQHSASQLERAKRLLELAEIGEISTPSMVPLL